MNTSWPTLTEAVFACEKCRLCQTRTNVVLGEGDLHAPLMFIGEGPGQQEDETGRPFVGAAGHLLDRMHAAIGLRPKVIVCLGSTPTRALLGEQMRITRDRGVWQLKKGVWFMPTYHPAALLRDADKKRPAWADFQAIRDKLIELNAYPKTEAE